MDVNNVDEEMNDVIDYVEERLLLVKKIKILMRLSTTLAFFSS